MVYMRSRAFTSTLSSLLILFGSSSVMADVCDDYSRLVDQHIAAVRSIGQQAEAANDAKSAADVIRQCQEEKTNWQRALAPINRALSQRYRSNIEPDRCQDTDERASAFFREEILIDAKVAQLAAKYGTQELGANK
jgi:hypothetical protein